MYFLFLRVRLHPRPTLFPYTTLFRSDLVVAQAGEGVQRDRGVPGIRAGHGQDEQPAAGQRGGQRRSPRTREVQLAERDRKSTRLNSSHRCISYAVFCLKKNTQREGVT